MDITVAICTRNRAASLARTLHSFTEIELPLGNWELLVVNNGSSDGTTEVIASFAARLPVREENEARPGLSNARNRAVATARGDYIVWTDDDVIVDQGWLVAYARAFERWPDASLFGGRIVPILEEPCVPWFRDNLALVSGAVAARDLGDHPIPLSQIEDRIPFGANYAVRLSDQRQFMYDTTIGPGTPFYGEETTLICEMLQAGYHGYWVPESLVQHLIGRERQTIRYVRGYYAVQGASLARRERSYSGVRFYGMPRWLVRRTLSRYLSYKIARVTSQSSVWLKRLIDLAQDEGALAYWRRSSE